MSRTVVYSSPFVPPEWIAAHGLVPLRMVPPAAKKALAEGVCPFAGAFAEAVLGREAGDALVLATTCDQMRRIAEQIAGHGSRDVFLMNVPATWETRTAREMYGEELRRMGRWMLRLGGTTPDGQRVGEAIRQCAKERRQSVSVEGDGIPLALVGGPLRKEDEWIGECVARAGGRIVLDATEGGERTWAAEVDEQRLAADAVEELTRVYFDSIPDAFRRPDTMLHEYLGRELQSRQVRGVLLVRHLWCDQWHAQLGRLRESTGLPVVEIDLGAENHALERTRNRIEALLNILK